jgi:hypothetical protein
MSSYTLNGIPLSEDLSQLLIQLAPLTGSTLSIDAVPEEYRAMLTPGVLVNATSGKPILTLTREPDCYETGDLINRCMVCLCDMGRDNPRQLCGKTICDRA